MGKMMGNPVILEIYQLQVLGIGDNRTEGSQSHIWTADMIPLSMDTLQMRAVQQTSEDKLKPLPINIVSTDFYMPDVPMVLGDEWPHDPGALVPQHNVIQVEGLPTTLLCNCFLDGLSFMGVHEYLNFYLEQLLF